MNHIIKLCDEIDAGYAAGKSALDDDLVESIIELCNHTAEIRANAQLADAARANAPQAPKVSSERAAFEAHAQSRGWDTTTDARGQWNDKTIYGAWIGWSARAARADAQPVAPAPDGKLHADGYFTWTRRDGYTMDRRLPCAFWLEPPAAPAPRQPLTEDQVFASEDLMHLNGMMLRLSMTNLMQVVRAIERAHGITEDTCPKT